MGFHVSAFAAIYTSKYLDKISRILDYVWKISTYCKNNIPVITNARGIISELLLEYNAGLFIKDITNLPPKIDSILINPYGPKELFLKELDFLNFRDVINKNFKL